MRILQRALLALLVGIVALEFTLQLAALIAWGMGGSAKTPGSGNGPVLCVGDSYTYGLGATATERSYPGVLQKLLAARLDPAPAVVNAGWPGQNSREALLRLEEQLETNQPRLVCVLVGLNDSWTRPSPVTEADLSERDSGGWAWRWRTLRLLHLLQRENPSVPGTPEPLQTEASAPGEASSAATGSYQVASRAVALVRAGRPAEALTTLERAIEADPANAPEYHQGLVQIHTSLGQRDRAAVSLEWLRNRYRTEPTQPVAEALATSLHAIGERRQAAELALSAVEPFPQGSVLWWIASQYHYDTGDLRAAEREIDRAIATAAPRNRDWIASLHRDLARACCDRDLDKAIRSLLAAMHIDRDIERCRLVVDGSPQAFGREALARCLQQIPLDRGDQELLQRLFGTGWADRTELCRVLAGHLRQIVQRCRDRGASVVVLGYPLPVEDIEAVQAEVAAEMQVPFVPCLPAFTAALRAHAREHLYVRDGHCTDAGYELMAATLQEKVLAGLRQ
jgi:lysophospholipase L1-like esterase/Tfp pilus assembly protein PilF